MKNIHADYAFPVDTLQDWVTYGDVFVTFTVTKAEPVPLSKEDAERSEGVLTESYLTAEIEEIHWTRPGASSIPPAVTFTWLAGVRTAGRDIPAVTNSGQVLEVGNRYVGLFYRMDSDRWRPLASETLAGVGPDGLVVVPNRAPSSSSQASIDGKSASEVGELLSTIPQYADFSADEDLTPLGPATDQLERSWSGSRWSRRSRSLDLSRGGPLERYCRVAEAGGPKGVLGLDPCEVAATATSATSSAD